MSHWKFEKYLIDRKPKSINIHKLLQQKIMLAIQMQE